MIEGSSTSEQLERLMLLSHQGDRQAFAQLCELRRNQLVGEVRRKFDPRLLSRLDASDVIQEVFWEANKRLDEVTGTEMPLVAWLRFLLNQKIIELQRRHIGTQKRSVSRERPLDHASINFDSVVEQLSDDISSPSHRAHRDEVTRRVKSLLAELSPLDREILVLRHTHDLSNAEVAESLGLSPNAASNRYVRALRRFKKVLDLSDDNLTGLP